MRPAGRRILLADDEVLLVRSLADLLAHRGWTVDEALDGETALGVARVRELDAALVDARLGRDSGLGALVAIKRLRPSVRVVLTSGYATETILEHAVEEGLLRLLDPSGSVVQIAEKLARAVSAEGAALLVDDDHTRVDAVSDELAALGVEILRGGRVREACAGVRGPGRVVVLEHGVRRLGATPALSIALEVAPVPTFVFTVPSGPGDPGDTNDVPVRFLEKPVHSDRLIEILEAP